MSAITPLGHSDSASVCSPRDALAGGLTSLPVHRHACCSCLELAKPATVMLNRRMQARN